MMNEYPQSNSVNGLVSPQDTGITSPQDYGVVSPQSNGVISPHVPDVVGTTATAAAPRDPLQEPKDDVNVEDYSTFEELARRLTDPHSRDVIKVRAIFSWLCSQKVKDANYPTADTNSPAEVLMKMKEGRASYTSMFAKLCRAVKIPCAVIHGYAKSVGYDVGDKKLTDLANTWNAVYVVHSWRLVFPLWACKVATGRPVKDADKQQTEISKSEGSINEYYFLTDPEEFIYRCFPEKPEWQLLRAPITKEMFLELPFCRPPFFEQNLKLMTRNSCILHSANGHLDISIKSLKEEELLMSYELLYLDEESETPLPSDLDLDHYVAVMNQKGRTTFRVRFPQKGYYQIDILGGVVGRTPAWLCSFKLVCKQVSNNPKPYPAIPEMGYGPCVATELGGLLPRSHIQSLIQIHARKELDFHFSLQKLVHVHTYLVSVNETIEQLAPYIKHKVMGNDLYINVGIPHPGEYALQIFTKDSYEEQYENVCCYLIVWDEPKTRQRRARTYETGAEKHARILLQEGLKSKNPDEMKRAIEKFHEYNLDDGGEIKRAQEKMEYINLSKALRNGILRRNAEVIQEALNNVKSSEHKEKFSHLIAEAEEVLEEVKKLKRFAHDILELSQKTVSELHRYKNPTPVMHDIMKCTYLILGEPRKNLEDWEDITYLMRQGGKNGLLNRIRSFDTVKINMLAARNAAVILRRYTEETAKTCSVGVGTFYVWCHNILAHFGLMEGELPPPEMFKEPSEPKVNKTSKQDKKEDVVDDDDDD